MLGFLNNITKIIELTTVAMLWIFGTVLLIAFLVKYAFCLVERNLNFYHALVQLKIDWFDVPKLKREINELANNSNQNKDEKTHTKKVRVDIKISYLGHSIFVCVEPKDALSDKIISSELKYIRSALVRQYYEFEFTEFGYTGYNYTILANSKYL